MTTERALRSVPALDAPGLSDHDDLSDDDDRADQVVSQRTEGWRLWLTPGGCRLRVTDADAD